MKPGRWQQVREILDHALGIPGEEQAAFLDKACAGDAELRSEVDSLVASHQLAGSQFLKAPAIDLNSVSTSNQRASRVGRRIGVYQITEEIGHGGMGEVYRARRVDGQYEKEVAVKLVRSGYDTSVILERFRHERQILATLDHPNIARLLDGGTTEDGIPYLVMELIDGTPIDAYCDQHQLPISERLGIFRQVCAAVHFAHQRLVVHRDLKPGNILVTEGGVPKLLDFGIAKILDSPGSAEATLLNALTPEYASPEQVRGEPITTSTDVYSVGVVLYRLLTGRSPYRVTTQSPAEFSRAITDMEPERPSSVALRTGTASLPLRDDSSAKLRRRLRGDLDAIVLKAIRKEPQQRYSSVEQLSDDLRREVEGLPVRAHKGSRGYRAGKFLRRHKLAMTASALIAITIAGGIAATVREARIADANARRAERRFNDVRDLANSLLFEIHDSIQSLPGATPARKLLLDRAVKYLDNLSQDASGDVNLERELAWGYHRLAQVQGDTMQSNLGQVHNAETNNAKAIALFDAVAKANPHNVTDQLNLAMAYRTRALFDIFETRGRAEIGQALAVTDLLMASDGGKIEVKNERAEELLILGHIQDAVGDRLQAMDSYRGVRDLQSEILRAKPDYPGIRRAVAKTTVAVAEQIGRFGPKEEGLEQMNAAIGSFEDLVKASDGDPALIRELSGTVSRRGSIEVRMGNFAAALSDFREARQPIERLVKLDPENQMLRSDLWINAYMEGWALAAAGRNADALPVLQHALQGYQSLHLEADVGPGPAAMEAWIAEAQAETHHLAEALENYKKAAAELAEDQANFDDARCDLAMVETKIGNTLLKMGKLSEAGEEYKKALATANPPSSLQHKDIPALDAAADAYAGLGDVAAAEASKSTSPAERSAVLREARSSYASSLDVLKQIPYPARITGNDYAAVADARQIAQRLANLPTR